jgi:DNA topoisomerase-1
LLNGLIHNGVVIVDPPEYHKLTIIIRGEPVMLMPKQEEMAIAWARKHGTPYVEDSVFVRNFLHDFSKELAIKPALKIDEVDFTPALDIVLAEREAKANMSKEERKALTAERKARREELKEKYGYAIVNGERVELANYIVEPSCIFMGRGKHPIRGRWKEGAKKSDVTLNLSPSATRPTDGWEQIVWQPESLWVARWKDRLSGKMKYVWLSDTAPVKQAREASKFDKAHELHAQLDMVRERIHADLNNENAKIREIATACYLIDTLCLRVGDEKDSDEADTVGATTLRPEHLKLHGNGIGEFKFLGKDSVLWHKKIELPDAVVKNLEELAQYARPVVSRLRNNNKKHPTRDKPQLFPGIGSRDVNAYLSEILPGLTAKVFRTHHATVAVQESLEASSVKLADPEYKKWEAAALANLNAAILCNHTKKAPTNWATRKEKFKERRQRAEARVEKYRVQIREYIEALGNLKKEAKEKISTSKTEHQKTQRKASYEKRIERAEHRIETARTRLEKAQFALGKLKARTAIATKNRTWNLGTSIKSYIEPRVYYQWGQWVGYDVLEKYYPKILHKKFAWVRDSEQENEDL